MTRPLGALCLGALLALTACPAKTDYGQSCKMTKPKGDTNCVPLPSNDDICGIPVSEMPRADFDYVSLGNAQCDDQVCIRTSVACTSPDDCPEGRACTNGFCAYDDETAGTGVGYCTRACVDDSDCLPDYQGGKSLTCTKLFFSPEYLAQLQAACSTDPDCLYNQIFGAGVQTKYCLYPSSSR